MMHIHVNILTSKDIFFQLIFIWLIMHCFPKLLIDRVFGPTTTTRHVYDIAAQHVVSGSMEGINGKSYEQSLIRKPDCLPFIYLQHFDIVFSCIFQELFLHMV